MDMHPVMTRQLDCLVRQDLAGLMENYAGDATVVRFDRVARGTAQISELFRGYLATRPEVVRITGYAQTEDVIFYRAVMRAGDGEPTDMVGTLVVRDGKVWRQTVAVTG
jgi:hypothetical protein